MSLPHLALCALIALALYQRPGSETRTRIDPGTLPVLVKPKVVIHSLEPSKGCQGAKDLRVTVRGQGFGTTSTGLHVYIGEDIKYEILAVRPDAIDVSLTISSSAPPGPRQVLVVRTENGPERGVLENGFTISTGVDLTLGEPESVIEPTRLVLRVPVKNIGCVASQPTLVSGKSSELGQSTIDKVPAIAPGDAYLAQLAFPLVDRHAAVAASVALVVDPEKLIVETNEENNQGSWRGEIPAVIAPAPTTKPNGSETPVWPWVLGGGVLLGAGAMGTRQQMKRRKEERAQGQLSWAVNNDTFESHIDRPAASTPFSLSIAVVEGVATHTIVRRANDKPTEKAVRS